MKALKLLLGALVVAVINIGTATTALATTNGSITVTKTCAAGISGTATFTGTVDGVPITTAAPLQIQCGHSVVIPSSDTSLLPAGTKIVLHESVTPPGAVAAADTIITLGPDNQTITINNAGAGALRIHKTCAAGVLGSATFVASVSFQGAHASTDPLEIPCGDTRAVFAANDLAVGSVVTLQETIPPTGAVAATISPLTLIAADQTITVNNGVPAGELSIRKTCGSGVTGSATFLVSAPAPSGTGTATDHITVACGDTVIVPETTGALAGALVAGAPVTITETTAPTGGVIAVPQMITLTSADRTVTVNNRAAAGALSIHKTCASGVTGSAIFSVSAPAPSGTGTVTLPSLAVPCEQTVTVPTGGPLAGALVVGAAATITETNAPPGALAAAVQTITLSSEARTVTINNVAAPTPPLIPGVLSLHKTCADGVTGSATFTVSATPAGGSLLGATVTVPCGQTVSVPLPALTGLLGVTATIHETTPPTGGSAVSDTTTTLSTAAQTITINNVAATAGALSLQKTCGTGVSGSATFAVTVTPPAGGAVTVPLTLACGQTITVPIPVVAALAGTVVTFHETVPATGAVAAADVTTTILGTAQTITINNVATSGAGAGGVARLAQTGGAASPTSLGFGLLAIAVGTLLMLLGVRLSIRRRV